MSLINNPATRTIARELAIAGALMLIPGPGWVGAAAMAGRAAFVGVRAVSALRTAGSAANIGMNVATAKDIGSAIAKGSEGGVMGKIAGKLVDAVKAPLTGRGINGQIRLTENKAALATKGAAATAVGGAALVGADGLTGGTSSELLGKGVVKGAEALGSTLAKLQTAASSVGTGVATGMGVDTTQPPQQQNPEPAAAERPAAPQHVAHKPEGGETPEPDGGNTADETPAQGAGTNPGLGFDLGLGGDGGFGSFIKNMFNGEAGGKMAGAMKNPFVQVAAIFGFMSGGVKNAVGLALITAILGTALGFIKPENDYSANGALATAGLQTPRPQSGTGTSGAFNNNATPPTGAPKPPAEERPLLTAQAPAPAPTPGGG